MTLHRSCQDKINIKLLEVQSTSHPSWQLFGGQVANAAERDGAGRDREKKGERDGRASTEYSVFLKTELRSCTRGHAPSCTKMPAR